MPPRRQISDEERRRLETLRSTAAAKRQEIIDEAPSVEDDPMGRVAWMAGADGNPDYPFNNDLREAINGARDARFQWREISTALGEDDDQATADRVNAKQAWRNRSFQEYQDGDPNPGVG